MKRFERIRFNLIVICVVLGVLAACCSSLWARPKTAHEAEDLVTGWLKVDPEPLGTSLGRQLRQVETFTNQSDEPIYHIVYLQPSGFVIVSADDLIEPIIGFVQGNSFDPSPENPLGALVTNDLNGRIAAVRGTFKLQTVDNQPSTSENQRNWRHFIELANTPNDKNAIALMSVGVDSISDVRVIPLVKSKWGQLTISTQGSLTVGKYCPLPCYNYYTPNNYLCGCPATALAQLMRYYEYPTAGIGVCEFTITIGWPTGPAQQAFTRGGDGLGGPYNWDLMPYVPNCDTPEVQRQAIGALCYDAGVSMNQTYSKNASGWPGCTNARTINALKTTFMYANAVHGYSGESSPIGDGLIGMINPNLDAKKPVILGTVQHAFVCDGYGYNDSTLYHHLNMGWLGLDDIWYDLRTSIISPVDGFNTGTVCSCVYNVQTLRAGDGEIVSGRVLDHNVEPIANSVLYVTSSGEFIAETETDDKGIYAFDFLESNTTYTVNAALNGYGFSSQEVTTGISLDNSIVSGNLWGVDLVGLLCDFNSDQKVNIEDLVMLIEHWGQDDPFFDVAPAPSGDGIVDVQDMEVLLQYWGIEVEIPEFGLLAHWRLDETEGIVAHDSAGQHDGTLNGDPQWRPLEGQVAGALEFDGVDDSISTPFVLSPPDGPFSVLAWVKGGVPGQAVLSQMGGSNWLCADALAGNLITELKGTGRGAAILSSQAVITDGNWHRIGLVWGGSHRTLYVDDVEVAKDSQAGFQDSIGGLYIGTGKAKEAGTFWSGLIDDVRIYNRALRKKQITELNQ